MPSSKAISELKSLLIACSTLMTLYDSPKEVQVGIGRSGKQRGRLLLVSSAAQGPYGEYINERQIYRTICFSHRDTTVLPRVLPCGFCDLGFFDTPTDHRLIEKPRIMEKIRDLFRGCENTNARCKGLWGEMGLAEKRLSGKRENTRKSTSTSSGHIIYASVSINYAYPVISWVVEFEQGPICGVADQMTWIWSEKRAHCFVMGHGGRSDLAFKRL